jgi:hypothetical protein
MLKELWRWMRGPEATPEQVIAAEQARRELEERREEVVDEYYEEGFPSREVGKGSLWLP